MSVPLRYEPPRGVVLHALSDYEPAHEPGEPGPRRWSSLRPARGPQLTLVAPPGEPEVPVTPEVLWRLLLRVLEVLDGRRAVAQLRTLLADPAYEALLTRLRTAPPGRRHRLRRLRTCHPTGAAVEAAAVIEITGPAPAGTRVCALAVRVERVADRWHCPVLRLL